MEILELHPATASGLVLGSSLAVPEGAAGVVVKDGRPLDILPSGSHLLEPSLLPLTMQALKIRPGTVPPSPLPAAVFLVQMASPWTVPWRCQALLSKNPASGMTYTVLAGRVTVQVSNPALFCGAILKAGGSNLATGAATMPQVIEGFLRGNLQALAAGAVMPLNLPPEQATSATEAIRTAAGHAAAGWLASVGLHCPAFDLDSVAPPSRTPCVICKSPTAPTGYALFQRNISLLYLRFTAKKEGNFCVPCAWKTAGAFNGVMLVAGWWGLIGLVLTPVYFCQNLYYLSRVVTAAKAAPAAPQGSE
jgi:hypothetical protein